MLECLFLAAVLRCHSNRQQLATRWASAESPKPVSKAQAMLRRVIRRGTACKAVFRSGVDCLNHSHPGASRRSSSSTESVPADLQLTAVQQNEQNPLDTLDDGY